MKIAIINTGSELFFDNTCNTNLTFISHHLLSYGLIPSFQVTVPDRLSEIIGVLKTALAGNDTVIITGGLGPTSDDLTREAVGRLAGQELVFDNEAAASLTNFFRRLNRPVHPANLGQVYLPAGSEALPNYRGTAPGFWLTIPLKKRRNIIALPGVPFELKTMFLEQILPRLTAGRRLSEGAVRKIKVFGIPESILAEQVINILKPFRDKLNIGFTVDSGGAIAIRLSLPPVAKAGIAGVLKKAENLVSKKLGDLIFGKDEERLESVVGRLLLKKNLTLALAESCTGGLISHYLTNVPGISRCLKESVVCYSNVSKAKRLGIPAGVIKKHGAVSPEVASLMARKAAGSAGTDIGLGVTGIAGPGGGTKQKPVGLVYIALYFNGKITVKSYNFSAAGGREVIKERTANMALDLLRHLCL